MGATIARGRQASVCRPFYVPGMFRVYEPWECGNDGYPEVWHRCRECGGTGTEPVVMHSEEPAIACWSCEGAGSVKNLVRQHADFRCIRCHHPYRAGEDGVWVEEIVARDFVGKQVEDPGRLFDDLPEVAAKIGWTKGAKVGKTKRVQYSACDGRCDHPGPVRWRPDGEGWHPATHATNSEVRSLVDNGYRVEAAWRILTVHHLNGHKHDLRWWNLESLCQRCHLSVQSRVIMERRYPFDHSDWFKPYVAGFYAYKYEGRDISREEAEDRMDDLLKYELAV